MYENRLLTGTDPSEPTPTHLRAGPLSLQFHAGDIRYVMLGPHELIRRIYVGIRDAAWDTVEADITNLQIKTKDSSFEATYDALSEHGPISFRWHARIRGDANGRVTYSFEGKALRDFHYNRIGICVLHPADVCAGKACRVKQTDGTVVAGNFPTLIAPHQPFTAIRAIEHEALYGSWVRVSFEGAVFEMEDQRNWMDASYKCYCPPLSEPYPFLIKRGEAIAQSVTVSLTGAIPAAEVAPVREAIRIHWSSAPTRTLPPLGLGMASHWKPLTPQEAERLRTLNLSHLRVDLRMRDVLLPGKLEKAANEAQTLDVPLEVAFFLSDDARDADTLAEVRDILGPHVACWNIFHDAEKTTPERALTLAKHVLEPSGQAVAVGGGTNVYFVNVNRQPPPLHLLDYVCFSINPQVHASDTLSLLETGPTVKSILDTANDVFGGLPVAVTPVTLKPRFNATRDVLERELSTTTDGLPPQVDVRQMSLVGAAWTLSCLKSLCEHPLTHHITLFETTGWRGVMDAEEIPASDEFPTPPGAVFPVYHLLADLGVCRGWEVLPSWSDRPHIVDSLVLRHGNNIFVLLANLTSDVQRCVLPTADTKGTVRFLTAANASWAMTLPQEYRVQAVEPLARNELELPPYALARIETRASAGDGR